MPPQQVGSVHAGGGESANPLTASRRKPLLSVVVAPIGQLLRPVIVGSCEHRDASCASLPPAESRRCFCCCLGSERRPGLSPGQPPPSAHGRPRRQRGRDALILANPVGIHDSEQLVGSDCRGSRQEVVVVSRIEPHHIGAGLVVERSDYVTTPLINDGSRVI